MTGLCLSVYLRDLFRDILELVPGQVGISALNRRQDRDLRRPPEVHLDFERIGSGREEIRVQGVTETVRSDSGRQYLPRAALHPRRSEPRAVVVAEDQIIRSDADAVFLELIEPGEERGGGSPGPSPTSGGLSHHQASRRG